MDASLRNTRELQSRLDRMQSELIRRFQNLVEMASIKRTDRSVTAVTQYQMKTETAALIRAAEDVQTLIRQLQEMWLFGQLDALGESKLQQKTDEDAKVVASLLKELTEKDAAAGQEGT